MDAVDELKEEMLEAVIRPFCGHCLADNCRLYHIHPDYCPGNPGQRVDSFCVVYRCNRCVPCQFAKGHVPYVPLLFDEHTGIIVMQTYWSRRKEYRRFLSMPEAHPGAKFHWCGLSNQWSNRRRKPR